MKNLLLPLATITTLSTSALAGLITAVPGPDDQGGMIMPMVSIIDADDTDNPTTGTLSINFNPPSTPALQNLETWSPGNWFADSAAWRADLGSPEGVGGTPAANAGSGGLFNNQYGFAFMSNPMMGMASIPSGKSLGIRLTALSDPDLAAYNYSSPANRWDQVFTAIDSQVLWNGSMWHTYFVLPADAAAGTYTAEFELFVADQAFTSGTGNADYTASALSATADPDFTPASLTYSFTVVPEPSTTALALLGVLASLGALRLRKNG
jgi:hypothetical protein